MAGPTIEQAYDAILARFWQQWQADTPALNGGEVVEVEWPNAEPADEPLSAGNKPWARVHVRHTWRDQKGFGDNAKMYTAQGLVTVQIFVPTGKQGLAVAARLGKVALDAFEGKRSGDGEVWFQNVTYREVGHDGPWYQANVTAGFTYDVVK